MAGKESHSILSQLLGKQIPCIAATVIESHGSTPQKPGSTAIIGSSGLLWGTVGGGTVEHSVLKISREALHRKISSVYSFSLDNHLDDEGGPVCGGGMKILIDAQPERHVPVFNAVSTSLNNRIPGVLVTMLKKGSTGSVIIERYWAVKGNLQLLKEQLDPEITNVLKNMLEFHLPGEFRSVEEFHTATGEKLQVLFQTLTPLPRLVIAGAGHIGKALSHLGKFLGFEVTVWDSRTEYAARENLPDADIILSGSFEMSFRASGFDKDTYVVIVTTGHRQDMEVLRIVINSGAGYIGMIGSRKKTVLLRDKFFSEGWATEDQWNRLYTPIGIDIHSESVEEIALSIAAEIVKIRHELNRQHE